MFKTMTFIGALFLSITAFGFDALTPPSHFQVGEDAEIFRDYQRMQSITPPEHIDFANDFNDTHPAEPVVQEPLHVDFGSRSNDFPDSDFETRRDDPHDNSRFQNMRLQFEDTKFEHLNFNAQ